MKKDELVKPKALNTVEVNGDTVTINKKAFARDSLYDAFSGMGGVNDILSRQITATSTYLTRNREHMTRLFRSNTWAKKICKIPASYCVKNWRNFESTDEDLLLNLKKYERLVNIQTKTYEALLWSNLFGGSLAIFMVDDGNALDEPLDLSKVKPGGLKDIKIVDRWNANVGIYPDYDILSDTLGEPEKYYITGTDNYYEVHRSRVHKFTAQILPYYEAQRENFWGVSLLENAMKQLTNDEVFLTSAANLVKKAGVDIYKIAGLSKMIINGQEEAVRKRVILNNQTLSTLNALVLDAGEGDGIGKEEYERITQSFGGFAEMSADSIQRLAAAAEIPLSIWQQKQVTGLGNTGGSDLLIFADRIEMERTLHVDPFLKKYDDIVAASLRAPVAEYNWASPFPKSEAEEAEIKTKNMAIVQGMHSLGFTAKSIVGKAAEYGIINNEDIEDNIASMEGMEEEFEEFGEGVGEGL